MGDLGERVTNQESEGQPESQDWGGGARRDGWGPVGSGEDYGPEGLRHALGGRPQEPSGAAWALLASRWLRQSVA